jgi:hypothetical protein
LCPGTNFQRRGPEVGFGEVEPRGINNFEIFLRRNYAGFSRRIARREHFDEAIETFSQQAD